MKTRSQDQNQISKRSTSCESETFELNLSKQFKKAFKEILRQFFFWTAILNLNKALQNNSKSIQENLKTIFVRGDYHKFEKSLTKQLKRTQGNHKTIFVQDVYPKLEKYLPKHFKIASNAICVQDGYPKFK